MIIRCPECSTGFRLSDDRVRGEPIKVRCTNCEHIFKAGLVEGKPTLYDTSGEPLPDDQQLAERDNEETGGDEAEPSGGEAPPGQASEQGGSGQTGTAGPGEGTETDEAGEGAPGAPNSPEASNVSGEAGTEGNAPAGAAPAQEQAADQDSEYDPFPHAGSEAQPKKPGAISGGASGAVAAGGGSGSAGPEEPASEGNPESFSDTADLDEESASEPAAESEGAVSVHPEHSGEPPEFEGEETAVGAPNKPDREPGAAPESDEAPSAGQSDDLGLDETVPPESAPEASPATETGDENQARYAAASGEDLPQDDDSIRAQQKDRESAAERGPQQGQQPDASTPASEAASEPTADESGGTPSNAQPPANSSGPPGPAGPASNAPSPSAESTTPGPAGGGSAPDATDSPAQTGGADFGTSDPGLAEPSSPPGAGGGLALEEVDRVDSQHYGSSGLQTVGNIVLALLVAAGAFVTLAASQNNWLFDFQELDQMARVAFAGAEYQARDELIREVPKPVEPPEPKNPIEFHDVFVRPVTLEEAPSSDDSKPEVLLLKGRAKNVSDGEQLGVKVRGIVYDESGKVITQASAPLGADISVGKIAGTGSPEEAAALVASEPASLPADDSRPFTIVFDSVPSAVKKGMHVDYRVEVADSYSPGESE